MSFLPRSRFRSRARRQPLAGPRVECLEARSLLTTLFVATGGSDQNPAGNPNAPFLSIQHAVTVAQSGDFIKVAAGDYGYNAAADREGNYSQNFGTTSVVTLINKQVTILGGFTTSDWGTYNPTGNVTAIDGGNVYRDMLVVGGTSPTSLDLRGFTVTQGLARGIPSRGGTDAIDGIGGGVLVDNAPTAFHDVLFSNNRAIGNDTTAAVGGAGAGGGLALRATSNATTGVLTNVSFVGNLAQGSSGASRGGFGQGGGLFTYQYTINGSNLSFQNNRAVGGSTQGGGSGSGDLADAQGGGVAIQLRSVANLSNVTATGNQAVGGPAPNGDAGGAYGGGVYAEVAALTLSDSVVQNNLAQGGDGNNGGTPAAGFGNGGGLMTTNTNTNIERSQFLGNIAKGGTGAVFKGVSGGGGLALVRKSGFSTFARLNNSVVAGNAEVYGGGSDDSRGGGGGGIWVDGPDTNILQTTVAQNGLVGSDPNRPTQEGQGILVGPSAATRLTLAFTAIIDHVNSLNSGTGLAAALSVQPGSTVTMNRDLFAHNSNDSNAGGVPSPAGTYSGYFQTSVFAQSFGAQNPGPPQYDYHPLAGSPAVDAASGSTEPVDITNQPRQGTPDIGAYELHSVPVSSRYVINDFNGDGTSDLAIIRPSTDQWFIRYSGGGGRVDQMGDPGQHDIAVPGDYNGDGTADLAVFRPATDQWFVRLSSNGGSRSLQLGDPGQHDIPVPGDYDGDGKTDLAVFRPSTDQWFIQLSSGGSRVVQMGDPSQHDTPVPADYDGDRKTDLAVFRPSTDQWFVRHSSDGSTQAEQMGDPAQHDVPVTGSYDGENKAGFAVFRPGNATFLIRYANGRGRVEPFGDPARGDIPVGYVGGITATGFALTSSGAGGIHASGAPAAQAVARNAASTLTAGRPRVVAAAEARHAGRGARHHGAAWLAALERLDVERRHS